MVRKRWLILMVTEYHSGVWKQLGQKPSPAVNDSYRVILLGMETAPPLQGDKKSNPYRKKIFLHIIITINMIMFSPVSCE